MPLTPKPGRIKSWQSVCVRAERSQHEEEGLRLFREKGGEERDAQALMPPQVPDAGKSTTLRQYK